MIRFIHPSIRPLLLENLVDLVDCLVAGRASLSMKTKLLTALWKKTISKNSCKYEIGNRDRL